MALHYFAHPITPAILFARLGAALLLGVIIGIDREKKNRPAGLRTHVLVCVGAALIAMMEQQWVADVVALGNPQINVSLGRITSAVVSGVGFLGAGTIVFSEHRITGLTTAASLWCTACIGLACGAGMEMAAVFVGCLVLIVLRALQKVVHVSTYKKLEVSFVHRAETLAFLHNFFETHGIVIVDADFHAENDKDGNSVYTNLYSLTIPKDFSTAQVITELSEYPNIRVARTRNV